MAKSKFSAKKIARLEAATRFVKGCNRVLCLTTAIAFGLLIVATAVPQYREHLKLQATLRNTQVREQATLDTKEYKEIQLHALRDDPSYLEVQARDRLNYYREGERILRFEH